MYIRLGRSANAPALLRTGAHPMKDHWEKAVISRPVNRQTALANSGGIHYQPKIKPSTLQRFECQPTHLLVKPLGNSIDLSGVKFGRFTVIGLLDRKSMGFCGKNSVAKWLVRCDCGRFEHRTAKSIRNPLNNQDRCCECRRLEMNKRRYEFEKTGRNK